MTSLLSVDSVSVEFGTIKALNNINLEIKQGEFIALLGPSGCGKTTLLRAIAGFQKPSQGNILISGTNISTLAPHQRPLNTVFQNYALFPHMNVLENVSYGPRRHGISRQEAKKRATEALDLVGLTGFSTRFPHQLSGGQQQRVALSRAIVNQPKLLLLDEPLSALDLKLRKRMQLELKHLQEKLGITFIFVTHDQEEALTMADRIVVMNTGRIEQVGTGIEIYDRPRTHFVADFIGDANLIPCRSIGDGRLTFNDGVGSCLAPPGTEAGSWLAVARPEQLALGTTTTCGNDYPQLIGCVTDVVNLGSHQIVYLDVGTTRIAVRQEGREERRLTNGDEVIIQIDPRTLHLVREES